MASVIEFVIKFCNPSFDCCLFSIYQDMRSSCNDIKVNLRRKRKHRIALEPCSPEEKRTIGLRFLHAVSQFLSSKFKTIIAITLL